MPTFNETVIIDVAGPNQLALQATASIGFSPSVAQMFFIFPDGTNLSNPPRGVIVHSPTYSKLGLWFDDTGPNDKFIFQNDVGASVLAVQVLGATPGVRVSTAGGFDAPQLRVESTSTKPNDSVRLRLQAPPGPGPDVGQNPFWDIAVNAGNDPLSFIAPFPSQRNVLSLFSEVGPSGHSLVHVEGDFTCSGTKSFVQAHPTDPTKEIAYVSLEGAEAGTYLRGTAWLLSGRATVDLPDHFRLVTKDEGLSVQLTPRGQWLQLYTADVSASRLVIEEAQGRSGEFDYLIQGVRRGFGDRPVIRERAAAPGPGRRPSRD
jgi:hypothetical protein